jgi:hypothetical protein
MTFPRPEPKSPAAVATEDDIDHVRYRMTAKRGSMPYLHDFVSLGELVDLFDGDRNRAIVAVNALVDRGEARFHENCSPPTYQAFRTIPASSGVSR